MTPTSLAVLDVGGARRRAGDSLAGGGAIVEPQDGPRRWAFKMAPTETTRSTPCSTTCSHKAATVATIASRPRSEGFLKATRR